MSDTDLPSRPRQLVLAAGVVIGGSVLLIAAVFDARVDLQSVDARERLQEVIGSSAGRELGVTLDQAIGAVRAALDLTAVCAAIAFVLGIFVLQRHRGARIALSVVAVPLLVTAPLVGGFLGALVAVATLMLWNGPAGDWYAGRPIRTRRSDDARASRRADGAEPPPPVDPPPAGGGEAPLSTRETSTSPGVTEGFGTPPADLGLEQRPLSEPWLPPAPAAGRPGTVRMACLLTWAFSGVVALLYLAAVVALLVDKQAIVDRVVDAPAWRNAGIDDDLLVPMLWFGVLLFLLWSLGAIVLAWFTWRRHDWARYLLAVSAALTILVGAIAFPIGVLHQIACAATIGGLFAHRSRGWFAGRGSG